MLRCWDADPAKRPTFADVYNELEVLSASHIASPNSSKAQSDNANTNYTELYN